MLLAFLDMVKAYAITETSIGVWTFPVGAYKDRGTLY